VSLIVQRVRDEKIFISESRNAVLSHDRSRVCRGVRNVIKTPRCN